jgi:hypothetical protein
MYDEMNSINKLFFVSAFITNINQRTDSEIIKYIENGRKLIDVDIFHIIFMERDIFHFFFRDIMAGCNSSISFFEYEIAENVVKKFEYFIIDKKIFVFFERTDMYFYQVIDSITDFNATSDNKEKNTVQYMFVQCHKTEWVKMAIYLLKQLEFEKKSVNKHLISNVDYYQFLWLDFGLYHVIKNVEVFETELKKLENRVVNHPYLDRVRIGSCWDFNVLYLFNIYRDITWYFAGGVFGGSTMKMIEFADLMKQKCLQVIKEQKTLMWEVNVWYLIHCDNKNIFDCYKCDHNPSIISNY